MAGKKGMVHYSYAVKLTAVRMFLEDGLSHAAITEMLGLRTQTLSQAWVMKYRREGAAAFARRAGPSKHQEAAARIRELEMQVALLKKFHTELRKEMLARRNIGSSTITRRNTR